MAKHETAWQDQNISAALYCTISTCLLWYHTKLTLISADQVSASSLAGHPSGPCRRREHHGKLVSSHMLALFQTFNSLSQIPDTFFAAFGLPYLLIISSITISLNLIVRSPPPPPLHDIKGDPQGLGDGE